MNCIENPVNLEIRRRIRVALSAYVYEFYSTAIMTDAEYDELSQLIDPSIVTGKPKLDQFFKEEFTPSTGMWIHKHPDLGGLHRLTCSLFPELGYYEVEK